MTTSFHVNLHDLQYILKQIRIAELHAEGMSTIAAIQQVYDVSAVDAALLPAGLRTVDGTDNNLLPGQEKLGAADQPFPRLTTPVFIDEKDMDRLGHFTNTNYGLPGNVVDADPRVISNLIVDQTVANPAAIYAALKVIGITGTAANDAVDAITSAYKATLTTAVSSRSASAAVTKAQAEMAKAVADHAAAAQAESAASAKVLFLDDAQASALTAQQDAIAAQAAVEALADALAAPEGQDLAAFLEAAQTAAAAAATSVAALITKLGSSPTEAALILHEKTSKLIDALASVDVTDAASLGIATTAAETYAAVPGGVAQQVVDGLQAELAPAIAEAVLRGATLATATAALNTAQANYAVAFANAGGATGSHEEALAYLDRLMASYDLQVGPEGGLRIENISPDIGLSPSFNSLFTIFGQFFDHGLDLVTKGGNGTVYMPLAADDPLIAGADKVFGTADDLPPMLRFMALTRATPVDANGVPQHTNTTTPYVDQNQTYTSHASHQVFLREQVRMDIGDGPRAYSTGRLLDGQMHGTIGTWADVKKQALDVLGIRLTDFDVHRVPLLATDAYGNLTLSDTGYAQLVMQDGTLKSGTAEGITTEGSLAAGAAFLDDIAHHANPGQYDSNFDRIPDTPMRPDVDPGVDDDLDPRTYDDEMLDAHFITGDGRGNENIGLTAVHAVFHAEHNRIFEENKLTILESRDLAVINEWLLKEMTQAQLDALPTDRGALEQFAEMLHWNGERLFQAARFSTEMQYQHMVFEEFARRIQPAVDPFVFTNTADIDPSILAEFAHAVYRFGHSMLTDTVDRIGNDLQPTSGDGSQLSLIEAFLNPQAYTATATDIADIQGAILRGLSMDVGAEIDEFIVPALRSNLLGLPLDLAALNIARARETGVASLNKVRAELYNDFGVADLKPYASWNDFAQHLKNPLSLINFVSAYGNHELIEQAATLEEKRAAATLLVLGAPLDVDGDGIDDDVPLDRRDFLDGRGAYAAGATGPSQRGGLDRVDLWVGGLAEKINEFGGMLGSTFNFIFEYQMQQLQNGDRFYYLSRTQGLNLLDALEANTFTDIMMRNSALGSVHAPHMSGSAFLTPDMILELDRGIAQRDYNPDGLGLDPIWDDPKLQTIDPKVRRDYEGSTKTDGGHDHGGTLVFRGGEHVVLGGTEGADTLISDIGDDTIWGDGGDDDINSGQGADQVFGGAGDDVIENPFGDDFLRGERGNDVIAAARGVNLLFGGQGQDVLIIGQDGSEGFGGEGNDFILGGSGPDNLLGNEGDDWIEGGEGFDTISGENSELFFNSSIIGHDVAWGQGNDQDYDLESGDDIAFSGVGVQRFEGMFGFDWAIGKYDIAGVNWDANLRIFTSVPSDILRDRFDAMEAFSGWRHDDVIRGDNRGSLGAVGGLDAGLDFADHALNREGLARITGMTDWFGDLRATLAELAPGSFDDETVMYRDGNILLGGAGSDLLEGRGGFDVIDGDAWLNVRIRILVGTEVYSAESLNSSTAAAGPFAGRVFHTHDNGDPDFTKPAFGGRSLTSLLLDRTINPGDMSIVREIRSSEAAGDVDTALFSGNLNEYLIEGRGERIDLNGDGDVGDSGENILQAAYDMNGDGFIAITDTLAARGGRVDDTDFLKNIERLQFADQIVDLTRPIGTVLDANISLRALVLPGSTSFPGQGATLGFLTSDIGGGSFSLRDNSSSLISVAADGRLSLTGALRSNQNHVMNLRLDLNGATQDETMVLRSGSTGVNVFAGEAMDEVIFASSGDDSLSGLGGDDVLYGQSGNDTIHGGHGNDRIAGGTGTDLITGGAGSDLIYYNWGDGTDSVDGGSDADTIRMAGSSGNNSVSAFWNGVNITAMAGFSSILIVEAIDLDLADGTDLLSYAKSSEDVEVDLGAGTATGFSSILNIENVTGGSGDDSITGNALANLLSGGSGSDLLVATVDAARDVFNGGSGLDTVDYGAYTSNLLIDLGLSQAVVTGSGIDAETSDTVIGVENLIGGAGNDLFFGSRAVNDLSGGAGDDQLFGNSGNDILDGGAGDDELIGGVGADQLTGGEGSDVFIFVALNHSSLSASDTILDFEGAGVAGGDVIDLNGLVAMPFDFVGSAAFTAGSTNQVRFVHEGENTIVLLDTDLDTGAEARIRLLGLYDLTAEDFRL